VLFLLTFQYAGSNNNKKRGPIPEWHHKVWVSGIPSERRQMREKGGGTKQKWPKWQHTKDHFCDAFELSNIKVLENR